jgi:phosphoribosylglycinamide formyltransferase-1
MPAASAPLPIVVLASGRGLTFRAVLEAQRSGRLPIDIRAVFSDRRTAPVLDIAEAAGIAAVALRPRDHADRAAFDRSLFEHVARFDPQLIVLAGYMRVIDAATVAPWRGRMINLHPSLLPRHPGLDTYARALAAGDRSYGSTVHYVTDQLDAGPAISQVSLPVQAGDTPDAMAARLRPFEQSLLVETLGLIATGRVVLTPTGAAVDGKAIVAPLQLDPAGGFPGL